MPEKINHQAVTALQAQFDAALAPADGKAFAVQIDRLFRRARLWRIDLPQQARNAAGVPIGPDPIAEMVEDYRADLGHLPADLLEKCITWACQNWRNGFRLPMPSELLEPVAADLARRKRERMKLGVVALKISHQPRDRSNPVDDAAAREAFAAMKANIAAAAPVRMMERRQDDGREPEDVQRAVKRGTATLTGLSLEERIQRAGNGGVE